MADGRRVFVYEVKLCREDGGGGSGWGVTIVTDTQDPEALLRVARVHLDATSFGGAETGLDEVKLLHTAVLDPRIAT